MFGSTATVNTKNIRRLRKGAVLFDAYKKTIVLEVADLIAFLADNPQIKYICEQVHNSAGKLSPISSLPLVYIFAL
tara:strand:+ start:862 stop:1089 length:228 start_codon:yes stop_codon:yes gene_type:complete